jgi:hypothetical protein
MLRTRIIPHLIFGRVAQGLIPPKNGVPHISILRCGHSREGANRSTSPTGNRPRQEPIPKTGIPKNKSRIREVFSTPKIRPSIHHEVTTIHHKFTIKKPRSTTRFPQNPLQKHKKPPSEKNDSNFPLNGVTFYSGCPSSLGEVGQGAGGSVNFINDDGVDSLRGNIVQKLFQSWPFHVAAGEAAIVIASGDIVPSLMALAEDVRFTRLSLGIERIEGLFQPLL